MMHANGSAGRREVRCSRLIAQPPVRTRCISVFPAVRSFRSIISGCRSYASVLVVASFGPTTGEATNAAGDYSAGWAPGYACQVPESWCPGPPVDPFLYAKLAGRIRPLRITTDGERAALEGRPAARIADGVSDYVTGHGGIFAGRAAFSPAQGAAILPTDRLRLRGSHRRHATEPAPGLGEFLPYCPIWRFPGSALTSMN